MKRGLGGITALLVLGLGLGFIRNSPPPVAAPPQAAAKTKQPPRSEERGRVPSHSKEAQVLNDQEEDLLNTVGSFLVHPPDAMQRLKAGDDPLTTEFKNLSQSGDQVYFALAIVPDPIHTHLSLFFDRTIDAIQQGAQQANWMFDRATMPWENGEHPESTDFRIRGEQEESQKHKEQLPGLMIFRPVEGDSSDHKPRVSLFVFVVGETPTGGINKEEFRRAIKLITTAPRTSKSLRIIGPTFSGSLYSLSELLNTDFPTGAFDSVTIHSGTVSSWETVQRFHDQWLNGCLCVDFATFQQSDRYVLRKFIDYENRKGYQPETIAVLTEDETAFGNVAGADNNSSPSAHSNPCPNVGKPPIPPAEDANLLAEENKVLHLYFPRNISQLRSAYQQGAQQTSASPSDAYQVRSTLPLNLQDAGSDDDTVPQYAHSQTPLSQESVLIGIVAAIRQHHIEFVVLKATNPMDTVFLSTFLKKSYSQARIVAMPGELLLSRDTDDTSLLHGVMALTTYSLLPEIREHVARPVFMTDESYADHVFPNAYAAGTYNAALAQATCISKETFTPGCKAVDPPSGMPVAPYTEYGWPTIAGNGALAVPLSPVVWLTALGRGGFWPVAVLDSGDQPYHAGTIASGPRPIDSASPPCQTEKNRNGLSETCCVYLIQPFYPTWPLFFGIVCGLLLISSVVFGMLLCCGSVIRSSSATMSVLAPVKDPYRSGIIVVIGLLILTTLLLLLWPWVTWRESRPLAEVCAWVGMIALGLLLALCAYQLGRRKAFRARFIFCCSATVLIVSFAALYRYGRHAFNPFLYRYIHLTSGVSPLLPFLCLLGAALWWAWFSLYGLTHVDKRRPRLPDIGDLPPSLATFRSLSEEFAKHLTRSSRPAAWDWRVFVPTLLLLAVLPFAIEYRHPILTLETAHFEWIFVAALGTLAFALVCTLFRLLVVWLECNRVLANLDRLPLRRAFAELNFAWEPIWRLGGGGWQDLYRLVSRQLEALQHLERSIEESGDRSPEATILVRSIDITMATKEKVFKRMMRLSNGAGNDPNAKEPRLSDYVIKKYRQLQASTAFTAAYALGFLVSKWRTDEGLIASEISSGEDSRAHSDDPKPLMPTRLAERFVSLIYLNFLLAILLRMRTLAIIAAGIYVFLVLAINSYPFEPKIVWRSLAILLLVFLLGIVGYVYGQVHRNSILSLVTNTKPGELGLEFWVRIVGFSALPLLSLLVSQFPALNNALFSWLEPAVSALK
jgi:hypothetical protein